MPIGTFQDCRYQCPYPCGEPLLTHVSTGDPPTLAGRFGSVFCGVTAPFLWVLVHTRFRLCPPRLESLFPPVLQKSYNWIPLAFKVRFPGDSQSFCHIPRLERLMWGSEHSQQREKFFGITFLQFIGQQVWGLLLSRLCPSSSITASSSSSLEMEYLFSLGSCVLLSMIVQQLVEILRLSQEKMGTCPFSPPCWTRSLINVILQS